MFTRQDLEDYCSQIIELENKMERAYRELANGLSHDKYKVLFERLAMEETQHANKMQELIGFLSE